MATIDIAQAAREDLLDIRAELEAYNLAASSHYERLFSQARHVLERFPLAGRVRPDFRPPHLRSLPVPPYFIVYRYQDPVVQIVRVLHGARNLPEIV